MNQGSIFNCGFALVMNKRFISLFLLIFTLMGMMACQEKKAVSQRLPLPAVRLCRLFSRSYPADSASNGVACFGGTDKICIFYNPLGSVFFRCADFSQLYYLSS